MVKLENVLVFDVPPTLALIGVIVNAYVAKGTKSKVMKIHNKVEEIESETNGNGVKHE